MDLILEVIFEMILEFFSITLSKFVDFCGKHKPRWVEFTIIFFVILPLFYGVINLQNVVMQFILVSILSAISALVIGIMKNMIKTLVK